MRLVIIVVMFFIVFTAVWSESYAGQDYTLNDRETDIYYEMASDVNNIPVEKATNDNVHDSIRSTGDKYGLTYQQSLDLYEKGRAWEMD
jgi:hypothetical protein